MSLDPRQNTGDAGPSGGDAGRRDHPPTVRYREAAAYQLRGSSDLTDDERARAATEAARQVRETLAARESATGVER